MRSPQLQLMESSQTLAIESFSHSWLTNVGSSIDGLQGSVRSSFEVSHEAASKEMEHYKILRSRRSSYAEEAQTFNFDVPIHQSPDALLHADQLFSDGVIKPVYANHSKMKASSSLDDLVPSVLPSSFSSRSTVVPVVHLHCHVFGRWRKSSGRILQKCFGFLRRPLSHRPKGSRKSRRVDDIDRISQEAKSWSNSPRESPARSSIAYSSADERCGNESPIYEAVLHCKRSIDQEKSIEEKSSGELLEMKLKRSSAACSLSPFLCPESSNLIMFIGLLIKRKSSPVAKL